MMASHLGPLLSDAEQAKSGCCRAKGPESRQPAEAVGTVAESAEAAVR